MKLFSKGSSKKKALREALLVDIGTGSVGVARVKFEKEGPRFTWLKRSRFSQGSISYEALSAEMLTTLATVLTEASTAVAGNLPDEVVCFLSSPWSVSEARSIAYEKPDEFKVTKDTIQDIRASAEKEIKTDLMKSAEAGNDLELIFHDFSKTRINGYLTGAPEGKSGRRIELSGFVGLAGKKIRKDIRAHVLRAFPHTEVTFMPASYAYYKGIETIAVAPSDYLFFDVRSELTEVLVVRDSELSYSGSFPFGSATALRSLSDVKNAEADRVSLFYDNKLTPTETENVRASLGSVQEEWNTYIEDFINSIKAYGALPATLLYATEDHASRFVKDIMQRKFGKGIRKEGVLVHIFDIPFERLITKGPGIESDSFLSLAALFSSSRNL